MSKTFDRTKVSPSVKTLTALGAVMAIAGAANAQTLTDAGSVVENTFTLDYSVNDTPQTQINNESGTPGDADGPTIFTVDRLVDLTVVATTPGIVVAPGAGLGPLADPTLTYTVTNTGNDNQSYSLSLGTLSSSDLGLPLASFTVEYFDGTAFVPIDTVTVGDTTTSDFTVDVPPGTSFDVRVSTTVPLSALDTEFDDVVLVAETRDPEDWIVATATAPVAGTLTVGETGNNTLNGEAQNILADADAALEGFDAAQNGNFAAVSQILIATPNITGEKTVQVIATNGIQNGTEDDTAAGCTFTEIAPGAVDATQFAVPGACVEYVITVSNLGGDTAANNLDATGIAISDTLPPELTFVEARVEGFAVAPTEVAPFPASGADCAVVTACVVSYENGTVSAPSAPGGAAVEAVVRIRALLK